MGEVGKHRVSEIYRARTDDDDDDDDNDDNDDEDDEDRAGGGGVAALPAPTTPRMAGYVLCRATGDSSVAKSLCRAVPVYGGGALPRGGRFSTGRVAQ